jgi:predicted O-methyltransferase YrrM
MLRYLSIQIVALAFRSEKLRTVWLKLTKVILLHTETKSFQKAELSFLYLLENNRIHIAGNGVLRDSDITFIDHGLNVVLDRNLLSIVVKALQELEIVLAKIQISEKNSTGLQIKTIDMLPFKDISELAASDNHYMFLASLAHVLKAERIVEIGTASGSSLTAFLSVPTVKIIDTFDVLPLADNANWVSKSSFKSINEYLDKNQGRWNQYVTDLANEEAWLIHLDKFLDADLIFVDADHSSKLERLLVQRLEGYVKPGAIFVLDDVRVSSMVRFWQDLKMSKVDVGGFAHFSGTGVSKFLDSSVSRP